MRVKRSIRDTISFVNRVLKIILICIFFLAAQLVKAETLQGGVDFDWINLKQNQRNELIEDYKNIVMNAQGLDFDAIMAKAMARDPRNFETAGKIKAGIEEDDTKFMAGFYKGKLLIAYGIIEKHNLKNAYYYDMLGHLYRIDYLEKNYGDYPYVTYQYGKKGKLVARVYNLSQYDQFMYEPEGKFLGRWYGNKLYNQNGKVTMGRSWF